MGLDWILLYSSTIVSARGKFKEIVKRYLLLREHFHIIVFFEIKEPSDL